jgi:hypothetical protein
LIAPIAVFALGVGAAFAVVSCGDSEEGLLPGATADQIVENLEEVERLVAEGDCSGAQQAAQEVASQVDALGSDVNARLRRALADGADELEQVALTDCTEETTETTFVPEETFTDEEPLTDTAPEEDEEEPTTEPEPTTQPTQPPPPPPEPPAPPPPPDDGSGSGGIGPGSGIEGEG